MQRRTLGNEKLSVSALGLGCKGVSEFYTGRDDEESIATIHRALDLGIDFSGYGRPVRALHQPATDGIGDQGPERPAGPGHQVRQSAE